MKWRTVGTGELLGFRELSGLGNCWDWGIVRIGRTVRMGGIVKTVVETGMAPVGRQGPPKSSFKELKVQLRGPSRESSTHNLEVRTQPGPHLSCAYWDGRHLHSPCTTLLPLPLEMSLLHVLPLLNFWGTQIKKRHFPAFKRDWNLQPERCSHLQLYLVPPKPFLPLLEQGWGSLGSCCLHCRVWSCGWGCLAVGCSIVGGVHVCTQELPLPNLFCSLLLVVQTWGFLLPIFYFPFPIHLSLSPQRTRQGESLRAPH